jgi:diacylglycerol O-acyltransferase
MERTVPQAHLDRLTSVDAGFLHQEDGGAHMHIGGLGVFAGPAPTGQEFRTHIASRLPLVPRYRQKLVKMPLGTGRPVWVEDASFRIGYHVRHTALPAPGGDEQLLTLVSRIVSQRLDRTKPLWEMWLVEGLADDRFALITKTHHAMIDGVGGIDLLTALFDLSPDSGPTDVVPWQPAATPGPVGLLAHGAVGAVRNLVRLSAKGVQLSTSPKAAVREVAGVAGALGAALGPIVNAAPPSVLNAPPGPHRRVEVVRTSLADYRTVKSAFGATVNDVVLAAVAGALGRFLEARGEQVQGLALRACVPVSLRTGDSSGSAGNEIAVMMAPLPVDIADPVERLAAVHRSMGHLKTSRQAEGAAVLTSLENALPPAILARASRLGFSSRVYNLLVTNVPGPQVPIYVLGRQLEELVPLAFLAPEHLLAIAIVSYHGQVTYGLLGDADALPDLGDLADHLTDTLAELVTAAADASPI